MSNLVAFPLAGPSLSSIAAANVRAEASRRRFSQSSLARALGVPRSTVADRWRGEKPWQLDELESVASVLGVTLATLLARSEGLEPPTCWLGVSRLATVTDIRTRMAVA